MKQKTKRTLSTAAYLAAVVAAIVFLNIIVGLAAEKMQLRWDLTENKLFALTDETKAVLNGLSEEVTLYYFVSSGQESAQIVQALDMYRTASTKLKIEKYDPNTDPIAARRFTDKGIQIQQNTIVLERGDRYRVILPSEMYLSHTTQSGETYNGAYFKLEQSLTRGIAYVADRESKKICFTVGHNEIDYSYVINTLKNENMETYQIDLKTATVPDDVDSVYIMAPVEDFTEEEILRLDSFLTKGKGVHVAFDARKKVLPRLEQYLAESWGVKMYHDLVCEGDSSRTLNYAYMFIPEIKVHQITESIATGNKSAVFMYTRSMELLQVDDVAAEILACTSEAGFSVHGSDRNIKDNIREGSLPVAASLTRKIRDGEESRLVVSGAYQSYDSFFMEEASLANRSLFYGITNYVTNDDSSALSVSPKSLLKRTVLLSDAMTVFYIIAVCVVPCIAFFAAGIIKWRRRRHL